jgi:hypothetical protein
VKTLRISSTVALVVMGIAGSALAGCTPDFDHLEITVDTSPPLAASVRQSSVTLPVGVAVGITATPFDTAGEEMEADVALALISENESVIGVDPSIEDRSFVLFGVGPGTTTISVEVDHRSRLDIPVTVKLQPAP